MSYLLDTNIIAELVSKKPNKKVVNWIDSIPANSLFISVLTIGEIRKGLEKISNTSRKEKIRIWLEHEIPNWFTNRILSIDHAIADRWGRLQYEAKRSLPAIDSLLAATALHHDLCMVTRNVQDFEVPGLEVINPWQTA